MIHNYIFCSGHDIDYPDYLEISPFPVASFPVVGTFGT